MRSSLKLISPMTIAFALAAALIIGSVQFALASHNGAAISHETASCGETTFTAQITDSAGGHKVSNMYLVVDTEDGEEQFVNVPTDGTAVEITTGPFFGSGEDLTISWNVFGGGERDYDQPLWNGYGTASFNSDVSAYAAEVGSFSWVIAGTDDANPFVNWNEVEVESCAITKNDCKKGGWEEFGFKNQGQCIRFANTGKDSR